MKELVILGAGIHAAVILDICFDADIAVRGLLDDNRSDDSQVLGVPIIGSFDAINDAEFVNSFDFIVGIGGSQDGRRKWSSEVLEQGGKLRTVAHPSSVVSRFSKIRFFSIFFNFSFIMKWTIFNVMKKSTMFFLDHKCFRIGDPQ